MPHGLALATFDAVLFDVDGTLVDSLGMLLPGLGDAIERYAGVRPEPEEIRQLIGMPIKAQMERYLNHSPTPQELEEMTDFTISRYERYQGEERLFEPACKALTLCKAAGKRTALVTSKNETELRLFLERFPCAHAVDTAVCASDVPHPKPAPDAALLALSRLGVRPGRAVFIGDSIYDLRCARAAGIANVAVGYGSADSATLLAEHPDLFLDTPEALLSWTLDTLTHSNAPQKTNFRRDHPTDVKRDEGAA